MDSKINEINKKPKFDIGLGILRAFLSFLIVMSHCYDPTNAVGYWKLAFYKTEGCYYHVRTFFILSLYFWYNTLVSSDISKKIRRLERLLIPYIIWPLIVFFLNKYLLLLIKVNNRRNLTFQDLKSQLLFGHNFLIPFWFQWNLIFISILFALIIIIFRRNYNFILLLLGIASFILQYNGKNVLYFNNGFNYFKSYTLGRIIESIPFAVTGFLIASFQVLTLLKKCRIKVIIVCCSIIYLLVNFQIFSDIKGFGNPGFKMYFLSICIFIIFSMFPSEKIQNKRVINIIRKITNYTAGVYFMHIPVYEYTEMYIISIQRRTIKGCISLFNMLFY
jgi:fucose 4-O-acetylase-like acetyltransferase